MSFWESIKRLFGGGTSQTPQPSAFAGQQSSQNKRDAVLRESPSSGLAVHREEIIDGRPSIAGYVFHVPPDGRGQPISPQGRLDALRADRVAQFSQRRLCLVPLLVEDWGRADFQELAGPKLFFQIDSPSAHGELSTWEAQVRAIRQAGAKVSVRLDGHMDFPEWLAMADMVVLDIKARAFQDYERWIKTFLARYPQIPIAAMGVSSWAEHRMYQVLGVGYSLGDFATQPDEEAQRDALNQSRLVLLDLLNLLRAEADTQQLSQVAKRNPGVVAKIMDMANSPALALSKPVTGLDEALMVLGREQLYRWVAVGVFRSGAAERDTLLLEIALTRARFLELTAQGRLSKTQADELFLVGMFSVLDSLLGLPMEIVFERIHVPQAVQEVLLRNEGPYAHYLSLALAVGRGQQEQVARMAERLGLGLDRLVQAQSDARAWAEEALQAS